MEGWSNLIEMSADYAINVLIAVVILVVGWVASWAISALVRRGLGRTSMHRTLARDIAGESAGESIDLDRWISNALFVVLMVFVLIAMFEVLLLQSITTPLSQMLAIVLEYAPRLGAAAIVIGIAWVLATLSRALIRRGLGALKLDSKLSRDTLPSDQATLAQTIANTAYWLIYLLFLPALLGVLQIEGLLGPVETMVDKVLAYLPNVALAALVLAVGWLAARLVQRLTTQALTSAGFDRLASTYRVDSVVGKGTTPSAALGVVVHVLILLPIVVAALNALQIEAVTAPAERVLELVIGAIPLVFGAAVLIGVSYFVARFTGNLVSQLMQAVGFDNVLRRLGFQTQEVPETGGSTPSQVLGHLVIVAIMLFATMEALSLLGFANLAGLVESLLYFFGHVLIGLVVIGLGIYLANLAASTIRASKAAQADTLAVIARVAVIVLAVAMGLQQMGLAEEIIVLAFGLSLGAVAIAAAIAFGIGGRDLAAKELERWVGISRSKK